MKNVAKNPEGNVSWFLRNSPGNIRVKTGTAEAYEIVDGQSVYRTHGWIVGAFDYNDKTYTFCFHMNFGGGGFYIAQSTKRYLNCVFNNFNDGCENI